MTVCRRPASPFAGRLPRSSHLAGGGRLHGPGLLVTMADRGKM